jgi:ketosteroid isomerase-like protein
MAQQKRSTRRRHTYRGIEAVRALIQGWPRAFEGFGAEIVIEVREWATKEAALEAIETSARMRSVDVVRRGFEYFVSTGDLPEDLLAQDFVWDMSHFRGCPEQPIYEGLAGAREFLRAWIEAWGNWELEAESWHEAGDQVVLALRQHGRAKATGMPLEMRFAQLFTLRDGKEIRMEMYAEPEEALRAAGLSR